MSEEKKRKFFKTVYTLTVLSDSPMPTEIAVEDDDEGNLDDLNYLTYQVTDGDCVGKLEKTSTEEVDPKTMAGLLDWAGSAPEFFDISESGIDLDEVAKEREKEGT